MLGNGGAQIEIVGAGQQATPQFDGVTLDAQSLNSLAAARLTIGGLATVLYGQGGNIIQMSNTSKSIVLRDGATLSAPEVFLVSSTGDIVLEQGASINALGHGNAAYDARDGFIYSVANMLAVSNGLLNVQLLEDTQGGGILIGKCTSAPCAGHTELYSQGSIVAATSGDFQLDDQARYGTRHPTLALNNINVGSPEALLGRQPAAGCLPA